MMTFIKKIIPVDAEYERKKQAKIKELRELMLSNISKVPATETDVIAYETPPKSLGKNAKEAENAAINESNELTPFYEDVCAELAKDKAFMAKMPKNASFDVEEVIKRDQNNNYFCSLQVRLDWARRLRCSIL